MAKYFYPLVENPFRKKDINEGIKVLKSQKLTIGSHTELFQKTFSKKIKSKNSLLVNSGSSANLLALQCLINPYRKKRLKKGDEVLIPALCWSTSLWPIIQSGLKPKFVDIDTKTLNLNLKELEKKISKKTKAILVVHVLGNCTNMDQLIKIKNKYNLILIEDTCESLGTKFKNKYLGTFGEFSSFSFYSSHQISSGEGGMICCKSSDDYEILKSLRAHGWSRGLKKEKKIAHSNKHLDKRFIFHNSGFNLRSTDISASIGLSQFKDIDKFIKIRANNRDKIFKRFLSSEKIRNKMRILSENNFTKPSWFGLPVIGNKYFNKDLFIKKIEKKGIETRPIISGNFLKQPAIKKYKLPYNKRMKNAEYISKKGFFIGLPTVKIENKILNKLIKSIEDCL